MALSSDTIEAVNRYGPQINRFARKHYGISGKALLAKLVQGESGDNPNAVSGAGARGRTQFMPSSRAKVMRRYGIDPWRSADEAVHAAVLHLQGKVNGSKGLEGYNPGDPNYARYILGQKVGKLGGAGGPAGASIPGYTARRYIPSTPDQTVVDKKAAVVDALLSHRGQGGLLKAITANLNSGRYTQTVPGTPGRYESTRVAGGELGSPGGGAASEIIRRANVIDAQRLPYQWGGGHAGRTPLNKAVPLDCSGAVSKVLGINPRVSGEFTKWGKPGRGAITVWANSTHVLLEVDGRFWGTSQSNPGGGAGWIPRAQITPGYLSRFTPRHL